MAVGIIAAAANGVVDQLIADYPWIQLHTGDPGAAGTSNVAGNTTRKDTTSSWAPATGGVATSDVDIDWSESEVTTAETYSHCTMWDASTAGNCGLSGTVTASAVAASGDAFKLEAGNATLTIPVAS